MGRHKEPVALMQAKRRVHTSKEELEKRKSMEVAPIADDIVAPEWLTKKQSEKFYRYAKQLTKIKVMGETDVDALARYVDAHEQYIKIARIMRRSSTFADIKEHDYWSTQYYKMTDACTKLARELGLTIMSRCRLVVPQTGEEEKKNKFDSFKVG